MRGSGKYLSRRKRRTIAGFKLLEMAIVLVVVVGLAAIVGPIMSAIREKARGAHSNNCADNMREITLALNQYVADNDQTYPERVNDLRQIGTLFFRHNVCASKQPGLVQVG